MKFPCVFLCVVLFHIATAFSDVGPEINKDGSSEIEKIKEASSEIEKRNPLNPNSPIPTSETLVAQGNKEIRNPIDKKKNVDFNEHLIEETDFKFNQAAGNQETQDNRIEKKLSRYRAEKVGLVKRDAHRNWPLGIVNYYVDTASYDVIVSQRLRSAMDMIEGASCVQFHPQMVVPQTGSWLHITNPDMERKCVHTPKYKPGGEIVIVLGLDCLKRRDILHTLLHAIGFNDEIAHPQRDQYVRVIWQNIQPAYRSLFNVKEGNPKSRVEYDPMSIMHFHDRAFSMNGKATIAALIPGLQINPSDKLSQLDKMKLRLFFGHECNRRKVDDLLDTCKNVLHQNYNVAALGQIVDNDEKLAIKKIVDENNAHQPVIPLSPDNDIPPKSPGQTLVGKGNRPLSINEQYVAEKLAAVTENIEPDLLRQNNIGKKMLKYYGYEKSKYPNKPFSNPKSEKTSNPKKQEESGKKLDASSSEVELQTEILFPARRRINTNRIVKDKKGLELLFD